MLYVLCARNATKLCIVDLDSIKFYEDTQVHTSRERSRLDHGGMWLKHD